MRYFAAENLLGGDLVNVLKIWVLAASRSLTSVETLRLGLMGVYTSDLVYPIRYFSLLSVFGCFCSDLSGLRYVLLLL